MLFYLPNASGSIFGKSDFHTSRAPETSNSPQRPLTHPIYKHRQLKCYHITFDILTPVIQHRMDNCANLISLKYFCDPKTTHTSWMQRLQLQLLDKCNRAYASQCSGLFFEKNTTQGPGYRKPAIG